MGTVVDLGCHNVIWSMRYSFDMYQPIDVINKTHEKFNNYNVSRHLKTMCTLNDIETYDGYYGHVEENFLKLKTKYLGVVLGLLLSNMKRRSHIVY